MFSGEFEFYPKLAKNTGKKCRNLAQEGVVFRFTATNTVEIKGNCSQRALLKKGKGCRKTVYVPLKS